MLTVQAAGEGNTGAVVRFLSQWVVDSDDLLLWLTKDLGH